MLRRAARTDANQTPIVEALRQAGAKVWLIGWPIDALVSYNGKTVLIEIKNPESRYGKKGPNGNQEKFLQEWTGGPVALVDSPEAALRVLELLK